MNNADLHEKIATLIPTLQGVHIESMDIPMDLDFLDLVARFAHMPGTVALVSGGNLDCARFHILGVMPWLTLSARHRRVCLTLDNNSAEFEADPFVVLCSIMKRLHLPNTDLPAPLAAGLLGYLAYDLKDCLEDLPHTSVDDLQLPTMLLYAPSVLVVHDKQTQSTRLCLPRCQRTYPKKSDDIIARFKAIMAVSAPAVPAYGVLALKPQANFSRKAYEEAIQKIINYIAAGDVYQVNLSQRFQTPFNGDSFSLFWDLFQRNPAPFYAFIQAADHQIISTSPERFLQRIGSRVEARPIKGTRPRGRNMQEDQILREQLATSAKDDAELSMIVDLLRNDIGKVCRAGSVRVAEHKCMQAYENVYHLVSIVEGELDADQDTVDLICAAFPGGSITGCPKVRSMQIIDELETCRRHVYSGAIGYIGFHDTMDLNIAIRTATIVNNTLNFSVGGGIVFDSTPQAEYEETLHKGRTLMDACRSSVTVGQEAMVWCNGGLIPAATATVPVSDQGLLYGYGFFETIRVDNGQAPLLADHLTRFNRSWQLLMPDNPPDLTWDAIIAQVIAANNLQNCCAAIKILATRGSRNTPPLDHTLLVSARPYIHRLTAINKNGIDLAVYPHKYQNPLADHKTLNYLYYLRAGQWAQAQGADEALILNPDQSISETNTANLLLINGRKVIRPQSPAVLPGVMAQAVCCQLMDWGYDIIEERLMVNDLHAAEQVLATNALMGAVPVMTVNGKPLSRSDSLYSRVNDVVIPAWQETIIDSNDSKMRPFLA